MDAPLSTVLPETNNHLFAPVEVMAGAINSHPELQRYKILFISGNHSRILSRLDRNITELDVRRANTLFQLMTILEENHHSFLIVEHDPLLTRTSRRWWDLAQALKQTSQEAKAPASALRRGALTCRRWPSWPTGCSVSQ